MNNSYYLHEMKKRLSENDLSILKSIYAPTVVAIPPSDAVRSVTVMPNGEIRVYGKLINSSQNSIYGFRSTDKAAYISSVDCGLTWKTVLITNGKQIRNASFNPKTGRFIEALTVHNSESIAGRIFDSSCEIKEGCTYALLCDGGANEEVGKVVKVFDKKIIAERKPLFLRCMDRCLIFGHCEENGAYKPVVALTDDDGETWRTTVIQQTPDGSQKSHMDKGVRWQNYCCEPDIAELSDGTLMMMLRTTTDYHYICYSHDGGESWTKPERSIFHGTNTMPALLKLSDRRLLFFWCNNQILPELNQYDLDYKLDQELFGTAEDYFTNRDANDIAISDDDGRTWAAAREFYLNEIRNASDFRSIRGVASSLDKSVHQAQMIELPYNKVLVHFGQNIASRKLVIFDIDWLYEKQRYENFKEGLKNISTHMYIKSVPGYYRGFSGHCAFNRTNGALLVPDPESNFEESLCIARVHDERLLYEKQGMVWNFPVSVKGKVNVKLRVMNSGVAISLSDHWYNPCDEYMSIQAHVNVRINKDVAPSHKWTNIKIIFNTNENIACVYADEKLIKTLKITKKVSIGLCYLHVQTLAEAEDFSGTLVKEISFNQI